MTRGQCVVLVVLLCLICFAAGGIHSSLRIYAAVIDDEPAYPNVTSANPDDVVTVWPEGMAIDSTVAQSIAWRDPRTAVCTAVRVQFDTLEDYQAWRREDPAFTCDVLYLLEVVVAGERLIEIRPSDLPVKP